MRSAASGGTPDPTSTAPDVPDAQDLTARARFIVTQSLGTLLLDLALHPPAVTDDAGSIVRGHLERHGLPAIELFTHGFLTDSTLLDAYLGHAEPPPPRSG